MNSFFRNVPQGWHRVPLKFLIEGSHNGAWGGEAGTDQIDAVCVRVADFDWQRLRLDLSDPTIRSFKLDQFRRLSLRDGDLILEKSGGGEKTPVGRVVMFSDTVPSVTSNFVSRVRPISSVWPKFFLYMMAAQYMSGFSIQFVKQNTGIQNLDDAALFRSDVWVPDLETQKAIADFLDRETARIDQLIEKKQRFVELLGERRQRIIDQLSTKGLQNDIGEKVDTGIDWLGEVPRHWTIEKLAWHFTAEKGRDAQKYTKEYCGEFTGPYPVYSGQTANEGVMGTIDSFDYYFGEQGVLFSTTVGAKAMTVSHLTGKFSLSQNCMIIIPVSKALPIRFYYYQLQPLFRKERSLIPEHMQASFRVEDLHRYWIAMPPRAEAEEIAGAIDAKLATLELVRQKTQHSIKSLREFRSALITAAVTGQIDVATWGQKGQTDRRLDEIQEAMGA